MKTQSALVWFGLVWFGLVSAACGKRTSSRIVTALNGCNIQVTCQTLITELDDSKGHVALNQGKQKLTLENVRCQGGSF
ncbi:hypothetical protein [Methyloterricola oryzae]|uniref:hypothetical protein n=1 Tax=Methyloterricola oryzae TaxID=1495050 RepID=UPI0011AEE509|nr:hypothetical protein [Methyloterricola oryzae]